MIFRFWQGNSQFVLLYSGIDPYNKYRLINYFINILETKNIEALLDFFRHLVYMMRQDEIYNILSGRDNIENDIELWKSNGIQFFFNLNENQQNQLIEHYNNHIYHYI
jgi:F0F1-type ATP synthase delta subunit